MRGESSPCLNPAQALMPGLRVKLRRLARGGGREVPFVRRRGPCNPAAGAREVRPSTRPHAVAAGGPAHSSWGTQPGPARPLQPAGLPGSVSFGFSASCPGAGLVALLVLRRPGAASSSLGLRLRVSPRVEARRLTRRLRLWTACVTSAPVSAVPKDVLDEEGGERFGLGGRQHGDCSLRPPRSRGRGLESGAFPASWPRRRPSGPRRRVELRPLLPAPLSLSAARRTIALGARRAASIGRAPEPRS